MKLTFWGAAKQVTGSMHMLTLPDGYTILIDCGMNYEQKKALHEMAFDFDFDPATINLVVLTHAHIDHSGNIPTLVNRGFDGNIICTTPTHELSKHLLFDSAKIQNSEYQYQLNQVPKHKRKKVPKPIYAEYEVKKAMERVVTLPFNKKFKINANTSIELIEAGHLLGAASVVVEYTANGKTTRVGFSGDLGRDHAELIRKPTPMQNLDYLICETTYGGRLHTPATEADTTLLKHVEESIVKLRGKLIIPAFSVGRTQSIVHALCRLSKNGLLPKVKVFVDSPLAIKSTQVYSHHEELLNDNALAFLKQHGTLFDFDGLHWIDNLNRHDAVTDYAQSCIIVSAAGMVEGGRIQEHVKNNIQNPFSTILIAGFCAEGTLGNRLLSGQKHIQIKGKNYTVYSQIAKTDVFSSHPDQNEILAYIKACQNPNLKAVYLVHGDEPNLITMQELIDKNKLVKATIPDLGQEFALLN